MVVITTALPTPCRAAGGGRTVAQVEQIMRSFGEFCMARFVASVLPFFLV